MVRRVQGRKQAIGVVAVVVVLLGSAWIAPSALATSCRLPVAVATVRGTLLRNEPADLFAGDQHHMVEFETDDEPARFLVFGKPSRLEVARTYEAEVYRFETTAAPETHYAWLHGDNLCGPNTSIVAVNDDGSTSPIARYPGLGLPVSRSEFLAGFAGFAAVVFLMSRLGRT